MKIHITLENDAAAAKAQEAQLGAVVMVKNDGVIKAATSDKPTVYIPMVFTPSSMSMLGVSPAKWDLPVDLKEANKYFNVITDTVGEPTGLPAAPAALPGLPPGMEGGAPGGDAPPADGAPPAGDAPGGTPPSGDAPVGEPTLTYNDIIRATPEQLAGIDFALVFAQSPNNAGGLLDKGVDPVTGEWIPISLQYGDYTATSQGVRSPSTAGDTIKTQVAGVYGTQTIESKEDRSYYGKKAQITNASDLDTILTTAANVPEGAKVVVCVTAQGSMIFSEFESKVDAILVGFGTSPSAYLAVASGSYEPTGLLPVQMPKNMETVEAQYEDVPRDMDVYVDGVGNAYDFAFGLNWSGVISDARVAKYGVPALTKPANPGK